MTEQLHQNVQIFGSDVPAAQLVRAISKARQLLLPVPAGATTDTRNILTDPRNHSDTPHRGAHPHCRQRCLRRLCKFFFSLFFKLIFFFLKAD